MNNYIRKIARTGLVARGSIYLIAGILTLLAALRLGGGTSGKSQVFQFLDKQPYGKALLALLAAGLICYSIWRIFQSIKDPDHLGNDKKGLLTRAGFFFNALIYLGIAYLAIQRMLNNSSGGSSSGKYVEMFGATTISIAFIVIGAVIAAIAVFLLIRLYKGDFLKRFYIKDEGLRKTAKNMGYFGYTARALVLGIIAFFFIQAGVYSNQNEIKGTQEAFSFLRESNYGSILMGVTAAGLACYGIFIIMLARYRDFRQ